MVLIEVLGSVSKECVDSISTILNTYSTFDVYGSIAAKTILFQSRDLDYFMTDDSLKHVHTLISAIITVKSFEKVVHRSSSEKNTVVYVRT